MKKVILVFLILIVPAVSFIYIFIPARMTISESVTIEANKDALFRKLSDPASWTHWWPGGPGMQEPGGSYLWETIAFKPKPSQIISIPVAIRADGENFDAQLTFVAFNTDTTTLHLETKTESSNLIKRVRSWFTARKLKTSFTTILQSLKTYSITRNLYDYDIQKKLVADSILVFTSTTVRGYPDNDKIYSLVDKLRNYIREHSAEETNYPMLNIFTSDSLDYLLKVAIPVNIKLPDSGEIKYRWMLGGGNILITEVKGGQHEIDMAYKQVTNYISDYHRLAPAIPFESLVTDRRKEPDSSKWITRIYYPVM